MQELFQLLQQAPWQSISYLILAPLLSSLSLVFQAFWACSWSLSSFLFSWALSSIFFQVLNNKHSVLLFLLSLLSCFLVRHDCISFVAYCISWWTSLAVVDVRTLKRFSSSVLIVGHFIFATSQRFWFWPCSVDLCSLSLMVADTRMRSLQTSAPRYTLTSWGN